MATKIIKFNNETDTYAPVTLASAVQYNTGDTPISVQDAIGTVAQSLIDVANNANGSYMSVSGASDPTIKILTPNGTAKSSYQFKGSGTGTGALTGHVTVSYANGVITFGATYTDTNYYDTIIDKGLSGYQIAEITANNTGSSSALHVPQATSTHLGVVQLGYTDANKGYALKLDKDGKGYVNVPWTDTVPDWKNAYAPIGHVNSKATTSAYGHVVVDNAINPISENPVQNKAINTALNNRAALNHTHELSWNMSPKTTDAGTEIAALVAVPSSITSLGWMNTAHATFTTYTLPTKKYVDNKIGDIGSALNFKGTVGPNETQTALPTSGVKVGDVWLVKLASGTNTDILSGQTLENGDMIIATNSNPAAWTVVNANWTATDGEPSVKVGASSPTTLATIGGVAIDIQVAQEDNVVHKSDLNTYVNGLNTATGTGVVTGAKLETNGGGQKLTLTYTDLSTEMRVGGSLDTIIEFKQNAQGKITNVTTAAISTMTPATASAAGTKGLVPTPTAGSQNKVLTGAATFKTISASQGNHATGLLYKTMDTMDTTEDFTLFDDSAFTGAAVSLATIASPAITVSLGPVFYGELVAPSKAVPTISLNGTINTPTLDTLTNMFYLDSWSNAAPTSISFGNNSNIKSIKKLKGLDTSKVTNMQYMFWNCSSLTSLDLSNFNTSNVTDMNNMFGGCSALTSLDLSNFNTSKVTNMNSMFGGCSALTSLGLSNLDTSKVTNMSFMFTDCSKLTTLDLSNLDTSNVTSMNSMFGGCSALTSLDLSNFNTSNVTTMFDMFRNCSSLKSLDLSNLDTSNVTNMTRMFQNCSSLKDVYITAEATLNKLTNNLTKQGYNYIPSSATIHYNGVDYKWQNNAWTPQS